MCLSSIRVLFIRAKILPESFDVETDFVYFISKGKKNIYVGDFRLISRSLLSILALGAGLLETDSFIMSSKVPFIASLVSNFSGHFSLPLPSYQK